MPFSLVFFYWEKGVFIEYVSLREQDDTSYIGCPYDSTYFSIGVWDPDNKPPIEEIINQFGIEINNLNIDNFQQLADATELTISEFYNLFVDKNFQGCLQTPKELWP